MIDRITSFTGRHRFLSNFWPAWVVYEDFAFSTVEHAYQAAKTLDFESRWIIQNSGTPALAKRHGRMVEKRPDWDAIKLEVMRDLVRQKFEHEDLRQRLLETGDAELVEGNHWGDTYWGVCRGVGANHLGRILMETREEVRSAY